MKISLSDELDVHIAEAAQLMTMLSQPARLKLLCVLLDGPRSVQVLADAMNLSQPAMSYHLKKLRDAGLVETTRDAQTIYYALAGTEVSAVLRVLYDLYCKPV